MRPPSRWTPVGRHPNESELLQRFHVEVIPFDMVEFINAAKDRARKDLARYLQEVTVLRSRFQV